MIRAVIIDDEKPARDALAEMLSLFCQETELIGEADGLQSGIELVQTLKPDLIFLDVEMPDGTGLDLVKEIEDINSQIVFVTGHNDYAVQAFRLSAVDYLMKPILPDQLIEAVNKVRMTVHQQVQYTTMMDNMNLLSNQERKVVLKDADSLYIIKIKQILRCQADGGYTHFFLHDKKQITTSVNLKEYEKMFGDYGFIRCHHSHLVNTQHIIRFDKADGGQAIMSDQSVVPVSFRKKEKLIRSLQSLSENPF